MPAIGARRRQTTPIAFRGVQTIINPTGTLERCGPKPDTHALLLTQPDQPMLIRDSRRPPPRAITDSNVDTGQNLHLDYMTTFVVCTRPPRELLLRPLPHIMHRVHRRGWSRNMRGSCYLIWRLVSDPTASGYHSDLEVRIRAYCRSQSQPVLGHRNCQPYGICLSLGAGGIRRTCHVRGGAQLHHLGIKFLISSIASRCSMGYQSHYNITIKQRTIGTRVTGGVQCHLLDPN